jgi:hypothetical protein
MKKVKLVDLSYLIKRNAMISAATMKKAYSLTLFGEIIKATPVDTGRARANWNISDNTPNYETTRSLQPKLGMGISGENDIYIANGLPYINRLDSGHSSQAPNGIIAPAIAATRNKFL